MSNHRTNDGGNEAQYIKEQKYVFKTILKTTSKNVIMRLKSPRLRISDPPPQKYFPISHTEKVCENLKTMHTEQAF